MESQTDIYYSCRRHRLVMQAAAGMGHVRPMLHLAQALSALNAFDITLFVMAGTLSAPQLADAQSTGIQVEQLQMIAGGGHGSVVNATATQLEQALISTISSSAAAAVPVAAFVTDALLSDLVQIPQKLGIPVYVFCVASASFLCAMHFALKLAARSPGPGAPFKDDPGVTVQVPGLPPELPVADMPAEFLCEQNWKWYSRVCSFLPRPRGFLINSCDAIEARAVTALLQGQITADANKEFYAVGPLVEKQAATATATSTSTSACHECVRWLDEQPPVSVVYVAFGSMVKPSPEQILELAHGLEASGHRFLWLLRTAKTPGPQVLANMETPADPSEMLPEGFLRRIGGRALVYGGWAPQVRILSHPSVGGFLSHCGWNSTVESIWSGVPLIAAPLAVDQRMNAFALVNDMKVALSMSRRAGVFHRHEVERAVKELMGSGTAAAELRENMKCLSRAATAAMAPGGTSALSLAAFAAAVNGSRPNPPSM